MDKRLKAGVNAKVVRSKFERLDHYVVLMKIKMSDRLKLNLKDSRMKE